MCMRNLTLSLMLLAGTSLLALESDRKQKIVLDGPSCKLQLKEQITVCNAGLTIRQGTLLIKSGKATIHHRDNQIDRIEMSGSPVYFEQQISAEDGAMEITAQRMDYRRAEDKIFMRGDVKIISSVGVTRGETMEFDLLTQEVTAGGESGGQQFHMVIDPEQ